MSLISSCDAPAPDLFPLEDRKRCETPDMTDFRAAVPTERNALPLIDFDAEQIEWPDDEGP